MNQEAFFACSDYISGSLSIPDLFRNMQNCTDYLASKGIGAIHTVSGVGFVANLDITIEKLFGLLNLFVQHTSCALSINEKI